MLNYKFACKNIAYPIITSAHSTLQNERYNNVSRTEFLLLILETRKLLFPFTLRVLYVEHSTLIKRYKVLKSKQ